MGQLLKLEPFERIAGHADGLFKSYAPRLHQYYSGANKGLESKDSSLKRPFPNAVFAACSINFGPKTVAHKHRDYGNLTWGWCAITSLGTYDYKTGGHLVLWDLNVVIEFPPGSTILLPSALLCHSNTSIAPDRTRYSFTQYSAGALFRWVDNNFQPQKKWASQASDADFEQRQKEQEARWQKGLDMLSSLDELRATLS
ncbi:hypothetical protein BDN70DRAFT_821563 [Pholiota conissans]|uniref:Uncharacterized protein n=1 Tax=Pholiota conissans TaxID=109636 RepID=A0A9P5YJV2_9AGAR|nr:hypothetical protein BDN70DRAFT_821563 [Pholiota conissans]